MIIVISSVLFSCSNHSLYDSAVAAAHPSLGSAYLPTYKHTHNIDIRDLQRSCVFMSLYITISTTAWLGRNSKIPSLATTKNK